MSDPLPPEFLAFLADNGIPRVLYDTPITTFPRFIRVNPFPPSGGAVTVERLATELACEVKPVKWLPAAMGFYELPGTASVKTCGLFEDGSVYAMDSSSAAAVAALDVKPGDHVLDLCCAPGMKLALIADTMARRGTLTGVDVSTARLAPCCTVLKKYGVVQVGSPQPEWHCRLFATSGTAFTESPPDCAKPSSAVCGTCSRVSQSAEAAGPVVVFDSIIENARKGKLVKRGAPPAYSAKRKRAACPDCPPSASSAVQIAAMCGETPSLYDKVLVDAECTHDGSLKHIAKYHTWGWHTFKDRVLQPERMATLTDLQGSLLSAGFHLVKYGGTLVYSTCSLTRAQNEDVVLTFLTRHPDAKLLPIDPFVPEDVCKPVWIPGLVEHTVRFDPFASGTSGLFVAKFTKCKPPETEKAKETSI